jgi:hypothetical protein
MINLLGKHSSEKRKEVVRIAPQSEIRPEKVEEVIVWNGLNKPDDRSEHAQEFVSLVKEASLGLQEAVNKFLESDVSKCLGELTIGTMCKNMGCKESYNGPESDNDVCTYHPGTQIFHEGMKYYSCCERKTSNFEAFLDQAGCKTGKHCWFKVGY